MLHILFHIILTHNRALHIFDFILYIPVAKIGLPSNSDHDNLQTQIRLLLKSRVCQFESSKGCDSYLAFAIFYHPLHSINQRYSTEKTLKIWGFKIISLIALKLKEFGFTVQLKDADGMANRAGPDQTAPEQSDQGLLCLLCLCYFV